MVRMCARSFGRLLHERVGALLGRRDGRAGVELGAQAAHQAELGEEVKAPAQDEEFVLMHSDNVQATGFVEHLKLPHYVDFQAELGLVRRLRADFARAADEADVAEAAE